MDRQPEFANHDARERVSSLYAQMPQSAVGSTIGGVVLTWVVWGSASHLALLVWLGFLVAVNMARLVLLRRYRAEAGIPDPDLPRWRNLGVAGSLVSATFLGFAGFLFFPAGEPLMQGVLAVQAAGMGAGAIASIAIYPRIGHATLALMFVPITLRFVLEGGAGNLTFAVVLILQFLVTLRFAKTFSDNLAKLLGTQARNLELIRNVTSEKAIAEEARAVSEAASRAKTQFFAAASHDLRQPLHALALFAAALQDKVRDPDVANVVNSINASVDALDGLFAELMDISKIDAGAIQPNPAHFPVQALFDKIRLDFEPEAFERGLVLRIRPTPLYAYSDAHLVERILRNLVNNAMRYTAQGGILVACRRRGGRLSIEVWDSGVGIAPDQRERIFDEFYQVGNEGRTSKKGMGLGLSIVKRLAGLLEARVDVTSRPGKGSVFRFDIPVGRIPAATLTVPRAQPGEAMDFSGRTVAVIEDELAVLDGMRVLLEGWGARVVSAQSAEEAQALAASLASAPDVLIADYRLGGTMTGVDIIGTFRERFGARLPAIIITGSTTPVHLEEAKIKDFHLLLKPVMPAKLRTLIHFKMKQQANQ